VAQSPTASSCGQAGMDASWGEVGLTPGTRAARHEGRRGEPPTTSVVTLIFLICS
jgi:hypothetical protein